MKKILIYCSLIMFLCFVPMTGQANQVHAFRVEEPLYLTEEADGSENGEESEEIDESESDTESEENDPQEQESTDDAGAEDEEETEFVLIPIFLILTVIIGILLYNFMKDREF